MNETRRITWYPIDVDAKHPIVQKVIVGRLHIDTGEVAAQQLDVALPEKALQIVPVNRHAVTLQLAQQPAIRASLLEYVQQREQDKINEEIARQKNKEERQAYEEYVERERQKYIAEHQDDAVDEEKGELEYLKQQKAWEEKQEIARQEFVERDNAERAQREAEKWARLQKAFPSDRLPASIPPAPEKQ